MKNSIIRLKRYLLPAGAILMLIISYHFAVRNTVDAWQLNFRLNNEVTHSNSLSYSPAYLERKDRNLKYLIHLYHIDTMTSRNAIINRISLIAESENVKLIEVPRQDQLNRTNEFNLQRLLFTGDYFSLLKTLNHLQSAEDIGIIRSVTLRKVIPVIGDSKTTFPVLEVYFEYTI